MSIKWMFNQCIFNLRSSNWCFDSNICFSSNIWKLIIIIFHNQFIFHFRNTKYWIYIDDGHTQIQPLYGIWWTIFHLENFQSKKKYKKKNMKYLIRIGIGNQHISMIFEVKYTNSYHAFITNIIIIPFYFIHDRNQRTERTKKKSTTTNKRQTTMIRCHIVENVYRSNECEECNEREQ